MNYKPSILGGFKYVLYFTPYLRKMIHFYEYFFEMGGSTAN